MFWLKYFFKNLVDDGFCLPGWMVGIWWDVEVHVRWLMVGPGGDCTFVYGDDHVQENNKLAGFLCGPSQFFIGKRSNKVSPTGAACLFADVTSPASKDVVNPSNHLSIF